MPGLKVAVANGNWSNPATWLNGTLPKAGDTVASNGFTITIDQNATVDSLINSAQAIIRHNPAMTSPTTPSGVVTSLPADSGLGDAAWRAFDGSGALSPAWYAYTSVFPIWIAYEYASPVAITQYSLNLRADSYDPKDWTFEAWNGSTWIVLDTVVNRTSGGSYTSPNFNNSTAYSRYRVNVSANRGASGLTIILEVNLFEYGYTQQSIGGGGFVLNSGVTLNANLFASGNALLTYSGTGTSTINGNLNVGTSSTASAVIFNSASGVLNIVGNVLKSNSGSASTLSITNTGTVNVVGDVTITFSNASMNTISMTAAATLNITGNVYTSAAYAYFITSLISTFSGCTLNITGNVTHNSSNSTNANCFTVGTNVNAIVTGTVSGGDFGTHAINNSGGVLRVVGSVISKVAGAGPAIISDSASVVNLMSGPFISSSYGFSPLRVVRMHLIPTATSYFEFRDETTNGAVSPGAIAPAARLVSPGSAVDAPTPANVRSGISYASGTLLGTMVVPSPSNVANNVPVDNTVGTAVLDPNAIWSVPLASINTLNSIGRRVKNAATVETTGAQIESILNSL